MMSIFYLLSHLIQYSGRHNENKERNSVKKNVR